MQLERYPLNFIRSREVFEFESIGPKGDIRKRIQFELVDSKQFIYNLAFGDIDAVTDEINDTVISNNGDSDKVLGTIVAATRFFFERHPFAFLYIIGSTSSRTRLYQMGINKHIDTAGVEFLILGETSDSWEIFKAGTTYKAFLVRKRN